jgi:hypothetical protein
VAYQTVILTPHPRGGFKPVMGQPEHRTLNIELRMAASGEAKWVIIPQKPVPIPYLMAFNY